MKPGSRYLPGERRRAVEQAGDISQQYAVGAVLIDLRPVGLGQLAKFGHMLRSDTVEHEVGTVDRGLCSVGSSLPMPPSSSSAACRGLTMGGSMMT